MSSKNQPPAPYPRRRGRTPKPTSHPIGRLIRERRLALGLAMADLAERVGIGPTSVSLIAAMEHGTLPPRRDVAERLAAALGLERDLLLEWSSMRVSPHAPDTVLDQRREYESSLRDQWETRVESLLDRDEPALLARAAPGASDPSPHTLRTVGPKDAPHALASDRIPVYPAGADPDTYRRRPVGYLDRAQIERLVQGKAELIRPIAYVVGDADLERLRRPSYPDTPPTSAIVSRPLPVTIDSREPYAIRVGGRVILAYCAWDGRDLVVLDPPGQTGFARLKARTADALESLVVGQVVAMSWWPIPD